MSTSYKEQVVDIYGDLLTATNNNIFFTNTKKEIANALENLSISDEKKADSLITLYSNIANTTINRTMTEAITIAEKELKIGVEVSILNSELEKNNKEIAFREAQIVSLGKEDTIKAQQNEKELALKDKVILDTVKKTEYTQAQIVSLGKEDILKDKEANKMDEQIELIIAQTNEVKESTLDRQQKRPVEVANLQKQGMLLDKQITKTTEDTNYIISQREQMIVQVGHNLKIKAMDSMADMIGTLGAGGLVPNNEIFKVYFTLNQGLTGVTPPTSYTITKA